MRRKQPYLPNNWQQYKDAPDDMFIDHTYEEFFDWKVNGWLLPSSVACIIRAENPKNGKVKEYVYQTQGHAKRKVKKLMEEQKDFVICDNEGIHHLIVKPITKYT